MTVRDFLISYSLFLISYLQLPDLYIPERYQVAMVLQGNMALFECTKAFHCFELAAIDQLFSSCRPTWW